MKKIFLMLLGIAATINAMAVDYTASAMVRVTSNTGYYSDFYYSESASLGALNGSTMNFEGRKVALYALNGTAKLQIIEGADLEGVQLGLMTDNGTDYTFNVSYVEGTNPLYLMDAQGENHELTQGASFTINGLAANSTIEDRFTLGRPSAPVAVASVTTNEDGWASFAYTADVAPADPSLAVYKGALNNSDPENPAIVLTAVTTGIPAGEGVFVHGEPLTTYYFSATTATAFSGNDLVGCTAATDPAGISDAIYTLRNVGGVTGLYNYVGTAAIPAGKAYLPIAVTPSSPAPQRIRMVINGAQGIEEVQGDNVPCTKFVENGQVFIRRGNEVYNLQGQIVK